MLARARWFPARSKYWHEPSHIFQARVLDSSAWWSTRSPCNQTSNQFNTLKLKAVLWWGTSHSLTTHWIRDRMYPVQTCYVTTKELPKLLKSAILCLCSRVSSCRVSIIQSFPLSNNPKNDTSGHFSQLRQRHKVNRESKVEELSGKIASSRRRRNRPDTLKQNASLNSHPSLPPPTPGRRPSAFLIGLQQKVPLKFCYIWPSSPHNA